MAQSELITINMLKDALGIPYSDSTKDIKLEQAISSASAAIRTYTDRDFGTALVTEARTFYYDGSGILEIDDCAIGSITSVTLSGSTLSSGAYSAQPQRRSNVHYWLMLPPAGRQSSEMQFMYNAHYSFPDAPVVVTASWGWPQIPDDVQQAAIYTAAAMAETPKPYTSQNFQSYSVQLPNPLVDAIPDRAQALLDPYQRLRL